MEPGRQAEVINDIGIAEAYRPWRLGSVLMWELWDTVRCPVLLLRGAESDLLPAYTAQEMTRRGGGTDRVRRPRSSAGTDDRGPDPADRRLSWRNVKPHRTDEPSTRISYMTKQLLHLVIGGELKDPTSTEFADLSKVELVGLYPNYAEACVAWRGKAQATIDNAHMRYFVVHLHRLMDPAAPASSPE